MYSSRDAAIYVWLLMWVFICGMDWIQFSSLNGWFGFILGALLFTPFNKDRNTNDKLEAQQKQGC